MAETFLVTRTKVPKSVNTWEVEYSTLTNEILNKDAFPPNAEFIERWDGERNYDAEIFAELLKERPRVLNDVDGLEWSAVTVVSPNGLLVRFRTNGLGKIPIHPRKTAPYDVRIARDWMETIFAAADAAQERARGVRE